MTAAPTFDTRRNGKARDLVRDVLACTGPFPFQAIGDVLNDPELNRPPQWVVQRFFVA